MKHFKLYSVLLVSLLGFYLIITYGLYFFYRYNRSAETFFDALQIIASLGAGVFIMRKGLAQGPINYIVYTGYACLIWSLGQLFWFAYVVVGREDLPYPSVAELAFLGAYFFLITAIKIKGCSNQQKRFYPALLASAAIVAITGVAVLYTGTLSTFEGVYSIIFMFVAAWTLFFALSLSGLPLWLRGSVSLLCMADLLLILQLILGTEQILFFSDPLYPLPFIIFVIGVSQDQSENSLVNRGRD